jgi:LPXTG-motif cell wall-anchored protein
VPPTTPPTLPPAAGPLQPGPGAHTPVAQVDALPRTGANGVGVTVAGGLTLVALGVTAVAVARRVRRDRATDATGVTP